MKLNWSLHAVEYFNYKLKNLFCEPYTLNPAPNRTLIKLGFDFVEEYETMPGKINFLQKVNRYVLTKEKFKKVTKLTKQWKKI